MLYTLVTRANGHIASHIVKQLLDQGLNVIGTGRSFNKATKLIKKFSKEFKSGKLRFPEVDFTDKPSIELSSTSTMISKRSFIQLKISPEMTTPEVLDNI